MSRSSHSKRWHMGERYMKSKAERSDAKVRKARRKSERERERRDKKVTECYSDQGHSSCGRKIRYESRAAALRYIERHYAKVPLSVYRCPYCGGWHLTSHPWDCADGGCVGEYRLAGVPRACEDVGEGDRDADVPDRERIDGPLVGDDDEGNWHL